MKVPFAMKGLRYLLDYEFDYGENENKDPGLIYVCPLVAEMNMGMDDLEYGPPILEVENLGSEVVDV